MNSKIVIATFLGAVVSFILGYLIWGVALTSFMTQNAGSARGVMKTEMGGENLLFIFLGNIAFAYLFTHIFYSWAKINTFEGGVRAGALIGLLMALGIELVSYGADNIINLNGTIVNIIARTILGALTGGVIAAYLGNRKTA